MLDFFIKTRQFSIFTGNINAFIHVEKMRKRSKKNTKPRFCKQHLFCMTTWQTIAARIVGHYIFFFSLNIHGERKY